MSSPGDRTGPPFFSEVALAFLTGNGFNAQTAQNLMSFVATLSEGFQPGGRAAADVFVGYVNSWASTHPVS